MTIFGQKGRAGPFCIVSMAQNTKEGKSPGMSHPLQTFLGENLLILRENTQSEGHDV